jgi:hypothetical protein
MLPTWNLLEQVFTVETIMTPRNQLLAWDGSAALDTLWQQAANLKIDTIPVTDHGQIIGILRRGETETSPLTPDWLISRDTSIPHLLEVFAAKKQPCLFVFHRQEIIGIVTPADFNKLPARTYFYNLLAELEMLIASRAREHFGQTQDVILTLLDRQGELEALKTHMAESDLEIDIIHTLNLSDMVNVICKVDTMRERLGFPSRKQVEKQLNGLVHLRNDIMHPVRLILDDYQGIDKLNERVQRALALLIRWNGD